MYHYSRRQRALDALRRRVLTSATIESRRKDAIISLSDQQLTKAAIKLTRHMDTELWSLLAATVLLVPSKGIAAASVVLLPDKSSLRMWI